MVNYAQQVNKEHKSLAEWQPPDDACKFIHSSINFCDEMDTHNYILDYDASITGTAGITNHPLTNIDDDFSTYWQADSGVAQNNQYFEYFVTVPILQP